jgi:hypothetical protein
MTWDRGDVTGRDTTGLLEERARWESKLQQLKDRLKVHRAASGDDFLARARAAECEACIKILEG